MFRSSEESRGKKEPRAGVYGQRKIGLKPDEDWTVLTNLDGQLMIPVSGVNQPRTGYDCLFRGLMELTVAWEVSMEWAYQRKIERLEDQCFYCERKGWQCDVCAVKGEVRGVKVFCDGLR